MQFVRTCRALVGFGAALLVAGAAWAQSSQKLAPEIKVTDARGIGKDVTLASLKGKWVVLEFWGHW